MPSVIEDAPLSLVNQAFQDKTKQWPVSVQEFFNQKLSEINLDSVSSINETPRGVALIDGQLVKFRGMVQDMHDPEIFMDQYGIKNLSTGETRLETCRYRDTTNLGNVLMFNFDSLHNILIITNQPNFPLTKISLVKTPHQ